jgi:RHS repeat-associated protein
MTTTLNDIYALGHLVEQTDGSGTILATFTYDVTGTPTNVVLGNPNSGPRYYYAYDAQGNVVDVTDRSGSVVASSSYDAFGALTSSSESFPTGWSNPFRYDGAQGVRYDAETGLYWMSVRAYDPTLGRFLSHDPLGRLAALGLDTQPYVYAGNNPVNDTDPSGMLFISGLGTGRQIAPPRKTTPPATPPGGGSGGGGSKLCKIAANDCSNNTSPPQRGHPKIAQVGLPELKAAAKFASVAINRLMNGANLLAGGLMMVYLAARGGGTDGLPQWVKEHVWNWLANLVNGLFIFAPIAIFASIGSALTAIGAKMLALGTEAAVVSSMFLFGSFDAVNWAQDSNVQGMFDFYSAVYGTINTLGHAIASVGSALSNVVNSAPWWLSDPINFLIGHLIPMPSQDAMMGWAQQAEQKELYLLTGYQ